MKTFDSSNIETWGQNAEMVLFSFRWLYCKINRIELSYQVKVSMYSHHTAWIGVPFTGVLILVQICSHAHARYPLEINPSCSKLIYLHTFLKSWKAAGKVWWEGYLGCHGTVFTSVKQELVGDAQNWSWAVKWVNCKANRLLRLQIAVKYYKVCSKWGETNISSKYQFFYFSVFSSEWAWNPDHCTVPACF